ncbi:MAG: sugar transferase, partial [Gemmatimonadota bacterium]|nr:sugar transferase [Gemmatimonadota bacterium]
MHFRVRTCRGACPLLKLGPFFPTVSSMSEAYVGQTRAEVAPRSPGGDSRPLSPLRERIVRSNAAEPEPVVLHSGFEDVAPRTRSERIQRVLNAIIATVLLILFLPVMALAAVAIKLTSRGPIFYTQTRVGIDRRWGPNQRHDERRKTDLGGLPFKIIKFRTMYVDAEKMTGAVWATQNDPRVTPVGRFLRQYRIDEVPQLINVIRGDMHIVGPRPERPGIVAELRKGISEYPIRQRVKPGITGLAQISQNYDTSLEDVRRKVGYDIEYLRSQSVTEDFRIMAKTVPVIL